MKTINKTIFAGILLSMMFALTYGGITPNAVDAVGFVGGITEGGLKPVGPASEGGVSSSVPSCSGTMTLEQFRVYEASGNVGRDMHVNGYTVTATYYNNTGCSIPVNLTSYKAFDNIIANQELFATVSGTVQPYTPLNLTVGIPHCMSQTDVYYGHTIPYNPAVYYPNSYNFGAIVNLDGDYCVEPLVVSCSASPTSVNVGDPITWSSTASGGTGAYTYSWTGTDGLLGGTKNVSKTYATAGTKTATITVTSGNKTESATCSATVIAQTPTLTASCYASPTSVNVGDSITWSSTASGGTGAYTYSWTGTDGLVGSTSSVVKTYSSSGTKNAIITVTSGSQTATATCNAVVTNPTVSLTASCYASPSSIQTGQSASFIGSASGGTGAYTYSWSGACSGYSSSCTNTFYNQGYQTANLTVASGSQTASTSCAVNVNQPNVNLYVSCYANPSSIQVGQSANFIADASGGTGAYTYSWSGACSGSGSTCNNYFYNSGTQTATITVYSAGQYGSANCSINVGQSGNANLTITKTVRNLTRGLGFANSVYASPSDTLLFMITVQNSGNQDAQNVVVRDTLPANLIYNNQLVVARSSNTYSNYSGDVVYGVNLNTVPVGQTVTITYQAQVASTENFSYGTTTLTNLASVTSSNAGSGSASASAIVTRSTVLGASTIVTGLTNNFWIDSFVLPLIITLIGLWMWRAGMFFGIEKWLDNKRKTRRGYKAEKELLAKIAEIKKATK